MSAKTEGESRPAVAFRTLAESVPHLVWTCDGEGVCDYLSKQWVAYTGIPAEEQLGFGWLDQLHPGDRAITQERWAAAAAAKGTFDTEFRIRRHDGVHRWFKTRAVPELDAEGNVVAWFGTNTDIQELRDAQEAKAALARELEDRVAAQTEELRAANDRLQTLAIQLETAQRITRVGSWEFDIASGQVVWSEELYRIFGLEPTEGAPPYETQQGIFTPESWERLTAAVERSVATGEGYELDLTALTSAGEERRAVARAEALRDDEGRVTHLVGTFQDVTEQREAEDVMRRMTQRLQLATSAAKMGVWDWDVVDGSLVWNEIMHEIYGTEPTEFDGGYEAWQRALHPDDLEPAETLLQAAVAGEAEFRTVFRIYDRSGQLRYIRAESEITRDAEGNALRMIGVNQDITEQRMAELTLRRAEALQRGILEAAGLAVIVTDLQGTITQLNPAAEQLLGYAAEDLVGKEDPGVFHDPDEVMARKAALEKELGVTLESPFETFVVKAREGGPDANEWTYVRKDGSRVPVWLVVSAVRDGEEVIGYLGVAADLTDRKRQEAELLSLNHLLAQRSDDAEAASDAKSRFLATMSHEIRTPIGAITGVSYLLGRTELTPEQREHVATIERSTKALLGMVNDILDLSKIEAGQLELEVAELSLQGLLADLERLMDAYAGDKPLTLQIEADRDVPERLVGDSMRLMQILVNLTSNAIKFTDEGSIRIHVSRGSGGVRFEVSDTGVGMEPEQAATVFEPFTQAHASTRAGGTGLGLAIVHELVSLMNGEVGLHSVPGEGTTVWVEIPLSQATGSRVSEAPTIRRVLAAVERPVVRQAIGLHGTSLGWQLVVADSCEEALIHLHESSFDLLILDETLCGESELDLLVELAGMAEADRPASVLLTTDAEVPQAMPGVDVLLGAPVSSSMLYDAAVRAAIKRRGAVALGSLEPITAELLRLPGVRALVVDDSEINRSVAQRVLELEGAEVALASDGAEAVRALADGLEVDIVLMDVQMPVMDGVEASRRILAHPERTELPIVALTAGAFSSQRERALAAGMVDFITKPYEPEALIAKVRAHVSRARGVPLGVASRGVATESQTPWPPIDGIDVADARARLAGDYALFRTLLAGLRADLEEGLASGVLEGDLDDARAWLHRTRGAAGNLGARRLSALAGEAERALIADEPERFGATTAALRVEIERVRQGIGQAEVLTPGRSPSPAGPARELDDESLRQVLALLDEQNLEAIDRIGELAEPLTARLGQPAFDELKEALARLDFVGARSVIGELR